jgi:hypothetical protein
MPCQKMLLAYQSAFFSKITSRIDLERNHSLTAVPEAAFYGGFRETQLSAIEIPEATAEQMSTFISWCYTGLLESSLCAEELWVPGDFLQSPDFANEAMYCLFSQHEAGLIGEQDQPTTHILMLLRAVGSEMTSSQPLPTRTHFVLQ